MADGTPRWAAGAWASPSWTAGAWIVLWWEYVLDGISALIDVAAAGTNGLAGLGASGAGTYRITAYAEPTGDVDGSTPTAVRTVTISGASATPPSATWDVPGVMVEAPALASSLATITLKATSAPSGYTVKLYLAFGAGSPTPSVDHTADVSPPLSAPPATNTPYTYDTAFPRTAPVESASLMTLAVRADLLDSLGALVDTRTVLASWYGEGFA